MSENHDEIVVQYDLPSNWAKETAFSFDHLSDVVAQLHESAYSASVKAINRFATVRNYVIGFYIVEYEQHGSDRAKYGDRLLINLAEKVNKRSINKTLLYNCRKFYLDYNLPFPLLSDPSTEMLQAFGAWGEKKLYGKSSMGTLRKTFIFDENGILERIIDKVDTKNHTAQIL